MAIVLAPITLSPDQERVRDAIVDFARGTGDLITIGGYAGTGKTTVVAEAVRALGPERPRINFCAISAKAASVLKSKLEAAGVLREDDYCGTIHGMIYNLASSRLKTTIEKKPEAEITDVRVPITERMEMDLQFWKNSKLGEGELVFLDEASMVSEAVFRDIAETSARVVAVGDHGQLPPVRAESYLMAAPMFRLEKIHRQAEGNPIVAVSRMAREDGRIPYGIFGDGVEKVRKTGDGAYMAPVDRNWMTICGRNTTRVFWNNALRKKFGFDAHDVMPGERVICLKNNRQAKIFNGMIGVVERVEAAGLHWYALAARMDLGSTFIGEVLKHQFGSQSTCFSYPPAGLSEYEVQDLFDWAWVVTTHKSQGSEWPAVCVIEERIMPADDDWRRWLYTAVTRAKERLLVVG